MKIALVIGKAVSTHKHATFRRQKALICQPLDLELKPTGRALIAIDSVGSGEGDVVLVIQEGRSARDYTGDPAAATRTMIVGIVDRVDMNSDEELSRLPEVFAHA
jgi:ethanolamine utilization protein EutN